MHKKGISLNSVEKFLSHSADKIRRRTLLCFQKILVSKSFKQRRGEASLYCRNFFQLTGPKKFRQGTILCFRKFLVGKNILWIRGGGGGYHDFPSKVLSHRTEVFRWRTLWCFRKILLSKILMHRRGGITVLSKFFLSQDPNEKLCKRTLLFSGNFFGIEKKLWVGGGLSQFSVEIFMSHSAEKFRKGIQLFLRNFLVSKSFMDEKAGYHVFPSKNFGLIAEKFRGHPFNVSEILEFRKILCIIGGITFFRRKFWVSQCRKTS